MTEIMFSLNLGTTFKQYGTYLCGGTY